MNALQQYIRKAKEAERLTKDIVEQMKNSKKFLSYFGLKIELDKNGAYPYQGETFIISGRKWYAPRAKELVRVQVRTEFNNPMSEVVIEENSPLIVQIVNNLFSARDYKFTKARISGSHVEGVDNTRYLRADDRF